MIKGLILKLSCVTVDWKCEIFWGGPDFLVVLQALTLVQKWNLDPSKKVGGFLGGSGKFMAILFLKPKALLLINLGLGAMVDLRSMSFRSIGQNLLKMDSTCLYCLWKPDTKAT